MQIKVVNEYSAGQHSLVGYSVPEEEEATASSPRSPKLNEHSQLDGSIYR